VVAVLLIHLLSAAVASMNPPTNRAGCEPTALTIRKAIRR